MDQQPQKHRQPRKRPRLDHDLIRPDRTATGAVLTARLGTQPDAERIRPARTARGGEVSSTLGRAPEQSKE